jgi:hypothetical protein
MTRRQKLMNAAAISQRIAGLIADLGYWPKDWALRVSLGSPGAWCTGCGRLAPRNSAGRLRGRALMLRLPADWPEAVLAKGLAVVKVPEGQVFVLDARPADEDWRIEGADGVWYLECAYPSGLQARIAVGWLVRYGGRDWFSDHSPMEALALAFAAVERGLGLEEDDPTGGIPF